MTALRLIDLDAGTRAPDRLRAVSLFDRIGSAYARQRRADPRIAAVVQAALGDARTVVNVGAGAGSYEPSDRDVLAVEPSADMRAQRPPEASPCIDGVAEDLPLADRSVDAAMAVYTDFHWGDLSRGIAEMARVSSDRVIVLTVDRTAAGRYWFTRDYLPAANDLFRALPRLTESLPGPCEITAVPIPHDCVDGFTHAFWRRPERLLDPEVRSALAMLDPIPAGTVDAAIERLDADLNDGSWRRRNRELLDRDELDLGHRLVVWRRPQSP